MIVHRARRIAAITLAAALLGGTLGLSACDNIKPSQDRAKELTFYDFAGAMRWGDFDKAYDFVDPQTKKDHPITDLEKDRFKQVEVAGYQVLAHNETKDTVDQKIKLDLVNRNTQIPRSVVYSEHWRWDPALKRWWLVSGLPDISPQE
ncbi:MAG: hypothetical protein JSR26_07645 [Proteobacteria bacterium]|nr:hypothetical protein [Pseudomonadota bacterium]